MRAFLALAVVVLTISGCVGAGPSPEVVAAVKQEREQTNALAMAHKITFVEAARRNNASVERAAGNSLSDEDRLLMSYRSALASEVDGARMTPEVAAYRFDEKKAEIDAHDAAQRQAALAALGNSLQTAAVLAQPPAPIFPAPSPFPARLQTMCMSNSIGSMVTTTCN